MKTEVKKILDYASMFVLPERREEFLTFIAPYIVTSDNVEQESEEVEDGGMMKEEDFIQLLEDKICSVFGIKAKSLYENSRRREIAYARHMCMWVMRKNTMMTMANISRRYNRHHSTAIHSYKMFEELFVFDKTFRNQSNAVAEHLAMHEYDGMKKDLNVLLVTNKVY
jgi:hypothetical protein